MDLNCLLHITYTGGFSTTLDSTITDYMNGIGSFEESGFDGKTRDIYYTIPSRWESYEKGLQDIGQAHGLKTKIYVL